MVGRPSPSQLISAVSAGVPVVLVGEFSSDSGAAWCIRTRCATEARTAVQVSEAVESACVAGRGEGKDLGTPRRAAQAALAHFASEPGGGAAAQEVELGSGLEPIGGPRERTPPRQPERHVEIEDALSRLKERMRDDDEG